MVCWMFGPFLLLYLSVNQARAVAFVDHQHRVLKDNPLAGSAEWNSMVEDTVVSCAGLVQYLADQWPPELQEGWLQY